VARLPLASSRRYASAADALAAARLVTAPVATTRDADAVRAPPVPFDLSTLQREAARLHGMTPAATQKVAQNLYTAGFISYPRTSSQRLPAGRGATMAGIVDKLLPVLNRAGDWAALLTRSRDAPLAGPKADPAHPAIFPTGRLPPAAWFRGGDGAGVDQSQARLFSMIARRFLVAFAGDATVRTRTVTVRQAESAARAKKTAPKEAGAPAFSTSGQVVVDPGWMTIYPVRLASAARVGGGAAGDDSDHGEESDSEDAAAGALPPTVNGPVDKRFAIARPPTTLHTRPPGFLTPTTLMSAMESLNLGTKSTRANIIETMGLRGYFVPPPADAGTSSNRLSVSAVGMAVCVVMQRFGVSIMDAALSATVGAQLAAVADAPTAAVMFRLKADVLAAGVGMVSTTKVSIMNNIPAVGSVLAGSIRKQRAVKKEENILLPCTACADGNLCLRTSKRGASMFVACNEYPRCATIMSLPVPGKVVDTGERVGKRALPVMRPLRSGAETFVFDPLVALADRQAYFDAQKGD
jgi:DNA topoisomerase-1